MYLLSKASQLLTNAHFYIILAILCFVISSGKKYVNISRIVKAYYEEFIYKNRSTILIIIVIPVCLANALNLEIVLDEKTTETICVIISILMSLFFTYLSYFQDSEKKEYEDYNFKRIHDQYLKETKAVASYEILISVLLLVICFVYPMIKNGLIKEFISGIVYFLLFHMLMNLLILLKRHNNNL